MYSCRSLTRRDGQHDTANVGSGIQGVSLSGVVFQRFGFETKDDHNRSLARIYFWIFNDIWTVDEKRKLALVLQGK